MLQNYIILLFFASKKVNKKKDSPLGLSFLVFSNTIIIYNVYNEPLGLKLAHYKYFFVSL